MGDNRKYQKMVSFWRAQSQRRMLLIMKVKGKRRPEQSRKASGRK